MEHNDITVSDGAVSGEQSSPIFSASVSMTELVKKSPITIPLEGSLIDGVVVAREGNSLFVDLGTWRPGIIYGKEYMNAANIVRKLGIGDCITAKVVELENENGYTELSLSEAGRDRTWEELRVMKEKGTVISTIILEANRGGLIAGVEGMRGFLPVSQLSSQKYPRVEGGDKNKILTELQKYVGETFSVRILDVNPREEKLIVSEKDVVRQDVRDALSHYHIGDIIEGEVSGVVDFGAFVKFGDGALEGLIHISELDYKLIEDPRRVVSVGDHVRAKIIGIDDGRISLSLKALKEDPWLNAGERYHRGDVISGEVIKRSAFGVFVKLDSDIHGLVHASEFPSREAFRNSLEVGKRYLFRIRSIEPAEHRLALSPAGGDNESDEAKNYETTEADKNAAADTSSRENSPSPQGEGELSENPAEKEDAGQARME